VVGLAVVVVYYFSLMMMLKMRTIHVGFCYVHLLLLVEDLQAHCEYQKPDNKQRTG
jgi:hypothetical protein